MVHEALRTLLEALEVVRPAFTRPGFGNLVVVFTGWVLTSGPHAITQALVVTGVAGRRHHEAFHRFFSRGTWDPDEVGRLLFGWILRQLPGQVPVRVVLDDTLATKKGPHVFGIGSHIDAVRSTRRQKIFAFGHCWVALAVLLPVPFSSRTFALPVLFRLYRTVKSCERAGHPHRQKTELARELLDVLARWVGPRRVEISADSAYCNDTVTRGLPDTFVLFGAMRPDAVLTAPPPTRSRRPGRPSRRGRPVAKPEAIDFARRRQLVVFDRFLARMSLAFGGAIMLKGGLVLELRLERARTTKDIDLRLAASKEQLLPRIQAAGRLDLGDIMTFEAAADPDTPEIVGDGVRYDGYRYRAECLLAGKVYGARFGLDVALGGAVIGDVEEVTTDDLLGFAGIAPPKLRVVPIETHLAEKLHADTMPRERPNTRVKDLPDLALLGTIRPLDAAQVRAAIERTFTSRRVQAVPERLPPPPEAWAGPYARMADLDDLPWRTLLEVEVVARAFVDPVLSSTREAQWDPASWTWNE